MQAGDQADDAESDDEDALDDAQRARLEAEDMLEIQRTAHDCDAGEEGEQEERTRAGQGHGGSDGLSGRALR
ncbi:hypothetical protein D3C81_1828530 [compost metagenome]